MFRLFQETGPTALTNFFQIPTNAYRFYKIKQIRVCNVGINTSVVNIFWGTANLEIFSTELNPNESDYLDFPYPFSLNTTDHIGEPLSIGISANTTINVSLLMKETNFPELNEDFLSVFRFVTTPIDNLYLSGPLTAPNRQLEIKSIKLHNASALGPIDALTFLEYDGTIYRHTYSSLAAKVNWELVSPQLPLIWREQLGGFRGSATINNPNDYITCIITGRYKNF